VRVLFARWDAQREGAGYGGVVAGPGARADVRHGRPAGDQGVRADEPETLTGIPDIVDAVLRLEVVRGVVELLER
jgi:hypothetical protein